MKFLGESSDKEDKKAVQIKKAFKITMQCTNPDCEFWGKMEGGPLVSDGEKAVFVCPDCETLNYMKWGFSF